MHRTLGQHVQPLPNWNVYKFGGSSLADAECFRRVANIVCAHSTRIAVVLSACRNVTDALLSLVSVAEEQGDWSDALSVLRARHADIAGGLLNEANAFLRELDADLRDIEGVLQTIRLSRNASSTLRDLVAGFGEVWSSRLFAAVLRQQGRPVQWLDARCALVVEWGQLGPSVDWERSQVQIDALVDRKFDGVLVITGFIASDPKGAQTTLGRNGSDYSASIFAALLHAAEIHIWTDVDGVLSADPRRVPEAQVVSSLSYNEAMELAYFGAKVLHPQTMGPAVTHGIPIWIRNTFAPGHPGSMICASPPAGSPVKGITSIEQVALITLEGAGMIGVPGTAHRLFEALRQAGVSVILISQGSSEHSICCAVPRVQSSAAATAIRNAFDRELREGQVQDVSIADDLAILAVVGDGMAGTPGVAAKVFGALAGANVNVRAIAQGSSERNISVAVGSESATRALRAVHAGFYLSPDTISIGVIGPGIVGRAFLDQLAGQNVRLRERFNVHLDVRALMTSSRMLLSEGGVDLRVWPERFSAQSTASADLDHFVDHVCAEHVPHWVVVDCTASDAVAGSYARLFARGVHVVTPNKRALSASLDYVEAMQAARRASGAHFLYEATVGAGLPIIQTIRDLRETGDEIGVVEGILSGTLAYLFNVYDGSTPFSEIVASARAQGFTEPDPRDDLSGRDVARKLIILGREMGLKLELGQVAVTSLVPEPLQHCDADEFMRRLPEFNAEMDARVGAARAKGAVLRHVGRVSADGTANVGLLELDGAHPFANSSMTDNIVRFATARYNRNPLIVQGPGAGPDVTAAAVFADLLRLASYLGARM
ncbi:MAG: bifunctional aspartate kinase/homoserine dehydrogenase I [Proteobacteria bacterium]|nr:bifunctional aspartate kinase/homoserine dehydrogenase I [Pseudomonadota bacterium]